MQKAFDSLYTEIICPVCGEKTLDNHWVCPTCLWEYDGLPEDHPSAANGMTMREYRKAYEQKHHGRTSE